MKEYNSCFISWSVNAGKQYEENKMRSILAIGEKLRSMSVKTRVRGKFSSDMNPCVFTFYFPLLMFILQLTDSLRWKVEHKVTDYGQNLILLCRVSNCCMKDAGWYLWTPTKRTILKDVKTASISVPQKYSGYVRTDGFSLIINNLTRADMNVSYSCDYGVQLGEKLVLHKDDVFKNDQSRLSITEFVLIIAGGSVLTILLIAVVICICCKTLSYEQLETDDPFKDDD
ncbi:uncharacterized protein LOC134689911 [Mytilus trossulus]|uniref:uncharacterized protein LOC134689911 n=1 Tax=Mytilus trossulus TaxID=6551 RepID=UPI003005C74D